MKWVLTKNRLTGNKQWQHGNCQPSDIPDPVAFRLLDDDGVVYFTGLLEQKAFENAPDYEAFEPLDTYGTAYGCTELQYKQNGHWQTL